MSVPPNEFLKYLAGTQGSQNFSSVENPPSNLSPAALQSWAQSLAAQQPDFRNPAEVSAYNQQLKPAAMMGVAPQFATPRAPSYVQPVPAAEAMVPQAASQENVPQVVPGQPMGGYDPYSGFEEGLLNVARLEKNAARNAYDFSRQIAQEEYAALKGRVDAAETARAEIENITKERETKLQQETSRLNDLGKIAADAKVTPFWEKASTGQKIGAGLAMALGAFGSAFTKGPNYAMQIIDKAIDDDLKAQQVNIDQNNKAFLNQREYINDIRSIYGDKIQQQLALRSMAYDKTENQLLQIAAKQKELMALPQFQQTMAMLQEKKMKTQLELEGLRANAMKAQKEAEMGGVGKPENFVPGLGYAYDGSGAKEMRTLVGDVNGAKTAIARLKQISEQGGKSLSPELRAEADTIRATLRGQLRTALVGPGAVTETEQKLLNDVIADPTTIFSLDKVNLKRLDSLEKALENKVNSAAQAQIIGFKPMQSGPQQAGSVSAEQLRQRDMQAYQKSIEALRQNPKDTKARQVYEISKQRLGL